MIIKNLAARCRKRKHIVIFEDRARRIQWLSDGTAAYPAFGIPWITEDQAMVMMDIPEKDRTKGMANNFGDINDRFNVEDGASDNEATAINLPMFWNGKLIYPTVTSQGIAFYDADTLNPIKDCEKPKLYERYTNEGNLYFVAKDGMMVEAVILPLNIKAKELLERMEQITDLLKAQAANEEGEET